MLCRIIFLIISFSFLTASSQKNKLDSLWNVWQNPSKPDTIRLKALNKFIWKGYLYSQPDSAFYFAQLQYDYALKKGLKSYQAAAFNTQGVACYLQGDFKKGIDYNLKSLKIREEIGDRYGTAMSLNNLGGMCQEEGNYAKAIDYYTQSLKIKEEIKDEGGVAMSLANIALIYYHQGDLEKAIDYSNKGLQLFKKVADKTGEANTLNSLGNMYEEKRDTAKAMQYYLTALSLHESSNDKNGAATSLNNIGYLYTNQGQYDKALEYYNKSLGYSIATEDKSGIAISYSNISALNKDKGNYKEAIEYGKKALAIAQEVGDIMQIKNASNTLYESYSKTGNYKDAFDMHLLFTQMKDSVQSEDSKSAVIKKDLNYNYEKQKALDAKEHEKEIALAREKQKHQKTISIVIAIGLVLVLFFTFFIIKRLRITSRQKAIIEKQKKLVEEQKHEVELQKHEADHQRELVQEKQKEIIDSITYAKRLQTAILPPSGYINKYLPGNFVLYQPKDIVAGDFYWMHVSEDGKKIYIGAADSTGHGVPGALVSIVCSNALDKAVKEFRLVKTGEILDKTTDIVLETFAKSGEEIKDGMDISLLCIDKGKNKITWSGANNQLWFIVDNKFNELTADKQPVGKSDKRRPFTTHEIEWKDNIVFYLMTDGYADQFGGPKGKKFKYKKLEELLTEISSLDCGAQEETLREQFASWKGQLEQVDDVCIIGVKI